MKAGFLYRDGKGSNSEFTVVCDFEMVEKIMSALREAIVDAAEHAQIESVINLVNQYQVLQGYVDQE